MDEVTKKESETAIRLTVERMEDGAEYILTCLAFAKIANSRKEDAQMERSRETYLIFSRKGTELFINNKRILNFSNRNIEFVLSRGVAWALRSGNIEKLERGSLNG